MKALYKVIVTRKLNNLLAGMWVEIVATAKPTPNQIKDAFNQKYGEGTTKGTIASYVLEIEKFGRNFQTLI